MDVDNNGCTEFSLVIKSECCEMVIIEAIVRVIKVKCFLLAKISSGVGGVHLLGKSNQIVQSALKFTFLQLNIRAESLLAGALVDLDSEQVEALHISNLIFQVGKFLLDVFSSTKEVDLFILVGNSCSLNGFTLTLGLKFSSVLLDITFTELKIVFDSVSFDFVIEYLF
jgi:hypothetical protein